MGELDYLDLTGFSNLSDLPLVQWINGLNGLMLWLFQVVIKRIRAIVIPGVVRER